MEVAYGQSNSRFFFSFYRVKDSCGIFFFRFCILSLGFA